MTPSSHAQLSSLPCCHTSSSANLVSSLLNIGPISSHFPQLPPRVNHMPFYLELILLLRTYTQFCIQQAVGLKYLRFTGSWGQWWLPLSKLPTYPPQTMQNNTNKKATQRNHTFSIPRIQRTPKLPINLTSNCTPNLKIYVQMGMRKYLRFFFNQVQFKYKPSWSVNPCK